MASQVNARKAPYNPVKAIEGMFNGSVTRIAYVFKDPASYGPSTKAVLGETSKRFQDALDDCEIQLLEAKWCLEHQLSLNKARREAKAQEDGASAAKRKADEMKDTVMTNGIPEEEEQPVKKQKVEEIGEDGLKGAMTSKKQEEVPQDKPGADDASKPEVAAKPEAVETVSVEPSKSQTTPPPGPPDVFNDQNRPSTSEGFPKSTPQDTPANDSYNFESMFGEPSGNSGDGNGDTLNFDLELNPDSFGTNMNLDDTSLNSLLPGVESYGNQGGDDNMLDFGNNTSNTNLDGNADGANEFGLTDIGNDWDALLNDDNGGADEIINDSSTINMEDYESFFN